MDIVFKNKRKGGRHKATIVVCTYKGNQEHLVQAVESYLNQEGCKIQLIVSTVKGDDSLKTLAGHKIKFAIQERPSIYQQLNNATSLIKHDWWCYMSGNDVALPTKVKTEIDLCIREKKRICYSAYNIVDSDLNFVRIAEFEKTYSLERNLEGNFVADTAMIHKSVSDSYLPFSEEFDNLGYWDFWLRIGQDHPEWFIYNPLPTWDYRVSGESRHVKRSQDSRWRKQELKDRQRMLERFGPLRGKYAR